MGFEYHDNEVVFVAPSSSKIVSGSFTVKAFSISPGQDPDHVNQVGDVHTMIVSKDAGHASLKFRAGRHRTKEVAKFWDGQIKPAQNTYDREPEELNFAFIGTLELEFSHPPVTAIFDGIALAQGSYDWRGPGFKYETFNDWWVGASTANYLGEGNIEVFGRGTNGEGVVALKLNRGFHQEVRNQIKWSMIKN